MTILHLPSACPTRRPSDQSSSPRFPCGSPPPRQSEYGIRNKGTKHRGKKKEGEVGPPSEDDPPSPFQAHSMPSWPPCSSPPAFHAIFAPNFFCVFISLQHPDMPRVTTKAKKQRIQNSPPRFPKPDPYIRFVTQPASHAKQMFFPITSVVLLRSSQKPFPGPVAVGKDVFA